MAFIFFGLLLLVYNIKMKDRRYKVEVLRAIEHRAESLAKLGGVSGWW
jgi:hypothetical protein